MKLVKDADAGPSKTNTPAAREVQRRALWVTAEPMQAATAILVVGVSARVAIHLLVHAPDIECAGWGRNADEN